MEQKNFAVNFYAHVENSDLLKMDLPRIHIIYVMVAEKRYIVGQKMSLDSTMVSDT